MASVQKLENGAESQENIPNWSEVVVQCAASVGMKVKYFHELYTVDKIIRDYYGKGRPGVRLKDERGNTTIAAYSDCNVG
jgi:hypothetical protein